jgi:ribonuclease HII
VSNARASDVAIVMGTSMNVQPAASLPDKCLENGGKLFIVNLQRTPYDQFATEKIYAKTDDFMYELMNELGLLEFETTFDLCTVMRKKEDAAARLKTIKKSAAIAGAVAAASVLAFVAWKRFVKK